ncbi:hypothetical protein PGT21_036035 [Puccinia graminis f. sp. tritici]|uniref:Uncharacterized protein n=1 Tax=Puccinia graminis f. sp. tritici TaxID=56615 RepID=A0A5B0PQ65_PUCGR|nr:hypothetical protein PGT21_036035 [Puccinia graminis f. sp. tritici]
MIVSFDDQRGVDGRDRLPEFRKNAANNYIDPPIFRSSRLTHERRFSLPIGQESIPLKPPNPPKQTLSPKAQKSPLSAQKLEPQDTEFLNEASKSLQSPPQQINHNKNYWEKNMQGEPKRFGTTFYCHEPHKMQPNFGFLGSNNLYNEPNYTQLNNVPCIHDPVINEQVGNPKGNIRPQFHFRKRATSLDGFNFEYQEPQTYGKIGGYMVCYPPVQNYSTRPLNNMNFPHQNTPLDQHQQILAQPFHQDQHFQPSFVKPLEETHHCQQGVFQPFNPHNHKPHQPTKSTQSSYYPCYPQDYQTHHENLHSKIYMPQNPPGVNYNQFSHNPDDISQQGFQKPLNFQDLPRHHENNGINQYPVQHFEAPDRYSSKDHPQHGKPDLNSIPEISNPWLNDESGNFPCFCQPSAPHFPMTKTNSQVGKMKHENHTTDAFEASYDYQMKDCPPTGEPDFKQIPEISNTWMNGERGPSLSFFQPSIPHYNTESVLKFGHMSNHIKPTFPQNMNNRAHTNSHVRQDLTAISSSSSLATSQMAEAKDSESSCKQNLDCVLYESQEYTISDNHFLSEAVMEKKPMCNKEWMDVQQMYNQYAHENKREPRTIKSLRARFWNMIHHPSEVCDISCPTYIQLSKRAQKAIEIKTFTMSAERQKSCFEKINEDEAVDAPTPDASLEFYSNQIQEKQSCNDIKSDADTISYLEWSELNRGFNEHNNHDKMIPRIKYDKIQVPTTKIQSGQPTTIDFKDISGKQQMYSDVDLARNSSRNSSSSDSIPFMNLRTNFQTKEEEIHGDKFLGLSMESSKVCMDESNSKGSSGLGLDAQRHNNSSKEEEINCYKNRLHEAELRIIFLEGKVAQMNDERSRECENHERIIQELQSENMNLRNRLTWEINSKSDLQHQLSNQTLELHRVHESKQNETTHLNQENNRISELLNKKVDELIMLQKQMRLIEGERGCSPAQDLYF